MSTDLNYSNSTPDLVVSVTGGGKTTLVASAAFYLYTKTGKSSRLYTADLGGFDVLKPLVDLGVMEVCSLRQLDPDQAVFETMWNAAQGWWPDAKGVLRVTARQDLEQYAGFFFEGLTSFGDWALSSLATKLATGKITGGPEASIKPFTDGSMKIAGNQLTHYSIAQNEIAKCAAMTSTLPGYKLWTALEMRATDEVGQFAKRPIFGAAMAGKAKASDIPAWFGNCLGLEVQVSDKVGQPTKRVLHLKTWFDADNPTVPHLCKVRDTALEGILPLAQRKQYAAAVAAAMPEQCEPHFEIFYEALLKARTASFEALRSAVQKVKDSKATP